MLAAKIGYFRTTTHPEASDWASRVATNGGSVSASTLAAVDAFCRAIDTAGIRDRFYRLNLLCGTGLSSCVVPLYRGPSFTGTQYGNTTDTNANFVSGDYVETGSSGGLKGNGTSKRLDTGFGTSSLPSAASRHISSYERVKATSTFKASIGGGPSTPSWNVVLLRTWNPATSYAFGVNGADIVDATGSSGGGHWIGQNSTLRAMQLYRNGTSRATGNASSDLLNASTSLLVLANSNTGTAVDFSNATTCSYSIGLHFTATQADAFHTALHAFNTSLGRNY